MADVNDHVVDNQWDSRLPTLSKFALAGVIIVVESVFVCAFGGVGGGVCRSFRPSQVFNGRIDSLKNQAKRC